MMTPIDQTAEIILTWQNHAPAIPNADLITDSHLKSHVYRGLRPEASEIAKILGLYESVPQSTFITLHTKFETAPQIIGTQSSQSVFPGFPSRPAIERVIAQAKLLVSRDAETGLLDEGSLKNSIFDTTIPGPPDVRSIHDVLPTDPRHRQPEDRPKA